MITALWPSSEIKRGSAPASNSLSSSKTTSSGAQSAIYDRNTVVSSQATAPSHFSDVKATSVLTSSQSSHLAQTPSAPLLNPLVNKYAAKGESALNMSCTVAYADKCPMYFYVKF